MEGAGKGAAVGRCRGGRGKGAAQKSTDASSMTAESVASKSPSSPTRSAAAVLLALSTTAPVTPQLASRCDAEVEDLTGSEKVVAAAGTAQVLPAAEETSQLQDKQRKRKERQAAAPSKTRMGQSSTSASEATLPRTSPNRLRKRPMSPRSSATVMISSIPPRRKTRKRQPHTVTPTQRF
jgi:hypothetical protein